MATSLLDKAKKSGLTPKATTTPKSVGGSLFEKAKTSGVKPTPPPEPEPEPTIGQKILGGVKKVGSALIQSEKRFGESIADAIFAPTAVKQIEEEQKTSAEMQQRIIARIKEKKAKGEDVTKMIELLKRAGGSQTQLEELVPSVKKSAKQIFGEGAGVATDIISFGSLPAVGKSVVKPAATTFVSGAIKGAKEGAKIGAFFGGAQSASRAAQEDKSTGEIIKEGVIGAGVGAATGGAIGGVTGGVGGALTGRAQRKAELRALMESGELTNAKLGKYQIPEVTLQKIQAKQQADAAVEAAKAAGKRKSIIRRLTAEADEAGKAMEASLPKNLKTDKVAKEAIRQGFDDADIAVVRTMSSADKAKAKQMYELAEKASQNKRIINRPMDIVGESVLKPARAVSKTLKDNAQKLDDIATGLKGKEVTAQSGISQRLDDDLGEIGASLGDDGIDFNGSTLEGLGGNEKVIQNVYNRIKNAKDAFDLHRVKRYIDTNVEYGKRTEGLVGEASNLLKGWRRAVDQALDTQFPEYNKVNTILAETIDQLDELHAVFGQKLNVNDPLSGIRAGQVTSRILTNSPNRGEIIKTINSMQAMAKKYGYKVDEDVINQVIFADMLEDVFGTQATRSLRGQVARGVADAQQVVEGGIDAAGGNIGSAIMKIGKAAINAPRGITNENKKRALEALLGIRKASTGAPGADIFTRDILKGAKEAGKEAIEEASKGGTTRGFINVGAILGAGGKNSAKVGALQDTIRNLNTRKVRLLDKGMSENSPAVKALVKAIKTAENKVFSLQRQ